MRFAICEDSQKEREKLIKQLTLAMKVLDVDAQIDWYETGEELLKGVNKVYYSGFFLDILLPGISGLEVALKLRRLGSYAPVAFTTVTNDYLTQSYNVWATDYLVKPIKDESVQNALARMLQAMQGEDKTLEITVSRHAEHIPYRDIYYIKGNNRISTIYTRNGIYEPYIGIQQLLNELAEDCFLSCHRSYIVNLNHVLGIIAGKFAMRNDMMIPIRKGEVKALRCKWEDLQFATMEGRDSL